MNDGHIGEGSGREFQRVAEALRSRMTDGTYAKNSFIPPQRELATEFDVSRDTIQRVLRELRNEGWIETRQGSGSRVIQTQFIQSVRAGARPDGIPTLSDLINDAFEQPEVTLDVYTLTSETLDAHIRTQVERIAQHKIAPQRIALRVLLPDESLPFPYGRTEGGVQDARLKKRFLDITSRHIASLRMTLDGLKSWEGVPEAELEVRHIMVVPTYKLYLFNKAEALHGPYPVRKRPIVMDDGSEEVEAIDVWGLGATLTHHVKDDNPNSPESVFVNSQQTWFDSAWELLTRECPL